MDEVLACHSAGCLATTMMTKNKTQYKMEPPLVCVPHVVAARRRGMLVGLLLGCLVMGMVAILAFWYLPRTTVTLYLTSALDRDMVLTPQPHASALPMRLALPDLDALALRADTLRAGYLMVPAVYSLPDEGYVIRMRLGLDNVLVVLDSGSGNLSVGTAECVKDALCSAHDGAYRPDASPHALNLQQRVNLQYASLEVDAHWWRDAAALPYVSANMCQRQPPALQHVSDEMTLPALLPVAAARRMDGTASNILGLMSSHARQLEPPVLEHMLASLNLPRRWSLVAYTNGSGWFIMGTFPSHCFPDTTLKYVPMSRDFSYLGAPCINVVGMRWKDAGGRWHAVPHGAFPKYAVLDTGTVETYATTPFIGTFARMGLPARNEFVHTLDGLPDVEIALDGGLNVVYGPKQYMVRVDGSSFRSTLHCGDEKVSALFGNDPVFLIGIHHMSGCVLDVDMQRKLVGLGRLPPLKHVQ